ARTLRGDPHLGRTARPGRGGDGACGGGLARGGWGQCACGVARGPPAAATAVADRRAGGAHRSRLRSGGRRPPRRGRRAAERLRCRVTVLRDGRRTVRPASSASVRSMMAASSTRTTDSPHRLAHEELRSLCEAAVRGDGGSADMPSALARATVDAEARGKTAVGAAHLPDYLDALRSGRLDGAAEPRVTGSRAAALTVDAANGTAQQAFESVIDDLVGRARDAGVAVLSIHRSFTAGELGYYARRLAALGLVAMTRANSPARVSVHGAREAVAGTNPMAFALPHPDGPRMFDQAASATAWVNVRAAADRGEAIPDGWALDPQGEPTT